MRDFLFVDVVVQRVRNIPLFHKTIDNHLQNCLKSCHPSFHSLFVDIINGWTLYSSVIINELINLNLWIYPYICIKKKTFFTKLSLVKLQLKVTGTVMQIEKTLINNRLCFKKILYIFHSNYLQFCSNLAVKFDFFLNSSPLFNSFYCLFCL